MAFACKTLDVHVTRTPSTVFGAVPRVMSVRLDMQDRVARWNAQVVLAILATATVSAIKAPLETVCARATPMHLADFGVLRIALNVPKITTARSARTVAQVWILV